MTPADVLTAFQADAVESLSQVLERHRIAADFSVKRGKENTVWQSFVFRGREYDLAIFKGNINLREGPNLYECYLSREFKTQQDLIRSFSQRLDRFLSGGPWEEPEENEPGPVMRLVRRLITVLRHAFRND